MADFASSRYRQKSNRSVAVMATANTYAPVSTSPSTGSSGDRPATPGQSSTATATALQPPSPTATDPTSRLLAPASSPLVRRLVYLVLFGVVMLSSTVVLSAAASLIRASPGTTKLLRSAASTAAPSILSASSTHEQLNKSKASRQPLPTAVTSTPTTKPLLDKRQTLFELYCRGSLLHDIQVNHVFADSKHFVDMPIKATSDAADIPSLYKAYIEQIGPQWMLMDQSERILLLKVFLDQHFDAPGSDMTAIVPRDYQDSTPPPAIAAITNPAFQEWAFQLHKLWQLLGRVALDGVTSSFLHATPVDDPELARTQNVLVVPGGRFRESYYWDSFWIVEGLLVSDMKLTARGVVNNLLEYVAEFGFVPNGGRIYYLTRSQPPLLSDMVKLIAEAGKPDAPHGSNAAKHVDLDYLRAVVPILEKEYAFWMQLGPSSHAVEIDAPAHYVHKQHGHSGHHHGHHGDHNKTIDDGDATTGDARSTKRFILNRYAAHANEPRPESYREDFHDATMVFDAVKLGLTSSEVAAKQSQLYNDIIAGAESGWDFTSRWFTDRKNMTTIDTTNVVPVDLNVMMHRFERNMAHFHTLLGDAHAAATYNHAALERADAIQTLLWSNKTHSWHDWVITEQTHSPVIASSNYSPLWADGLVDLTDDETVENIVESLRSSGLIQVGGIQATTLVTGQQWDGPNAWPPSQDMVIEGLMALKGSKQAQVLARELMRTWVKAGYVAWQKTGLMFEKYNATTIGGIGTGGEYIPQFGFGWTNGVILKYLAKHQDKLDGVDVDDSSNDGNSYGSN